jgi:diguanylate cyclase (GGDEF)-like protein/PAS domain S-box-containing protein
MDHERAGPAIGLQDRDDLVPKAAEPDRPGGRARLLPVALAGIAAAVAWFVLPKPSQHHVYDAVMLAALAVAALGAWGRKGPTRTGWRIVALAVACSAVAQLLRTVDPSADAGAMPLASQLLSLAADLLMVVAVTAVLGAYGSVRQRGELLDALTVGVALTALWWPAFIEPVTAGGPLPLVDRVTIVANPVSNLLLVAVAVHILPFAARRSAAHALLGLGLVADLGADFAFETGGPVGGVAPSLAVELAWLGAATLLALATLLAPDGDVDELDTHDVVRRRIYAMLSVTVLCPTVLLTAAALGGQLRGTVLVAGVCSIVTFVLVILRLANLVGLERESAEQRGISRFAALVQSSQDAIFVVGVDGTISYASPSVERMTGLTPDDAVGSQLTALFPQAERVTVAEHLARAVTLESADGIDLDGHYVDAQGDVGEYEMTIVNLLTTREVMGLVVTMRDVTGRKRLERELARKALRDDLTGLANRALFMDRLEHALLRLQRTPGTVAVMFLDLDDFKAVNDGLGHSAGDALLVAVAERLQRCMRPSDTIARLGGDEFAVLLEEIDDADAAVATAERLLETLQLPVAIDNLAVNVPASIGVAATSDRAASETLMRDADIALYRAKADGKARVALFDQSMRWAAYERLRVRTELSRAIEQDALRLMYQPIVVLGTDEIRGAEALLRWEHPTLGTVPPSEFIPLAEESGLILSIGLWVLERACAAAAKWNEVAGRDVYVSVNVSARQLREVAFADEVARVLQQTELRPELLMLELTETALIDELAAENLVERVVPLGVAIAIDDFGTGYSSLAYLQRLPVNVVKIDRSFVSGIDNDGTRAVVESIAAIARVMGFSSIAEGVETDEQLTHLEAFDCRYGQGYRYSEPVDEETLTALLRAGAGWRSPEVAAQEAPA